MRLPSTWACARCRRSLWAAGFRSFSATGRAKSGSTGSGSGSSSGAGSGSGSGRRRAIILTASGGVAASTVLAFTDDIKQGYETVERTGRVAAALVLCINDYRTTLAQREKMADAEERAETLRKCHKRCAERTLRVLERSGGIYIKLGQHLSAMNYLLPPEWTTTFVPLQDRCPVSSLASIEQLFRDDTGTTLWEHFSAFEATPIGAASLAQVHLATERATGRRVAVKVQHPDLAQWAPLDLALTRFTFSTLRRFFPEYDLEWLSAEMEVSLPQELDFCLEADNARRTAQHFAALPPARRRQMPLVVPAVLSARPRILVMACEPGHRLDDLAYLDAHGIDRDAVSTALAHVFNEMVFGDGAPLHCDPHGGNLAVRAKLVPWYQRLIPLASPLPFEIILYDHGLYREIPQALRRSYAKMWLAVLDGDMVRMRRFAQEVAGPEAINDTSFPLFAAAITGRDFGAVQSAALLRQPRSEAEKQNMGRMLQDGLLVDLVQLLGRVPRILLLILKTNDLTRSLDENLQTRQGPVAVFLVMARYCARVVLDERLEGVARRSPWLWPPSAVALFGAYWEYLRIVAKLDALQVWMRLQRLLGRSGSAALAI